MAKARQTRRFAATKRRIALTDDRIKRKDQHKRLQSLAEKSKVPRMTVKHNPEIFPRLKDSYNEALGPPYHILLDTNYVNFSIKNRLDLFRSIMDSLLSNYCVMGEIEKMSERYRVALKILRDERIRRLTCQHRGTYADDCLVERCKSLCYIVATCDKDMRRRIRKITGVPIMYIKGHRVTVEKMPMALGAPKI